MAIHPVTQDFMKVVKKEGNGATVINEDGQSVTIQGTEEWVLGEDKTLIFQVKVRSKTCEKDNVVAVGLSNKRELKQRPGSFKGSYGYWSDGSRWINGKRHALQLPTYASFDVVVIGLNGRTGEIFCALNRTVIGTIGVVKDSKSTWIPTVSLARASCRIDFELPFIQFKPSSLRFPLTPFLTEYPSTYLCTSKILVLYLHKEKDDRQQQLKAEFAQAAEYARDTHQIASFYLTKLTNSNEIKALQERVQLDKTVCFVLDLDQNDFTHVLNESITSQAIRQFLDRISSTVVTTRKAAAPPPTPPPPFSFSKSLERPASDRSSQFPVLLEIVASSFETMVVYSPKDVLFLLYNPDDDYSRQALYVLLHMALIFRTSEHFTIAFMKENGNDVHPHYFTNDKYKLRFFQDTAATNFNGTLAVGNVIDFVHSLTRIKFDLDQLREQSVSVRATAKDLVRQAKQREQERLKNMPRQEIGETEIAESKGMDTVRFSIARPENDKHYLYPDLVQVVALSFGELVLESQRDVLLMVAAQEGPALQVVNTVAQALEGNPLILVAMINEDDDLHKYYFKSVSSGDVFYFQQRQMVKFSGQVSVTEQSKQLLKFMWRHNRGKFDLKAATHHVDEVGSRASDSDMPKSETRPAGDVHPEYPSLIKAVGSSFVELVLQSAIPVLMLRWKEGDSAEVLSTVALLSQALKDDPTVSVVFYDRGNNSEHKHYQWGNHLVHLIKNRKRVPLTTKLDDADSIINWLDAKVPNFDANKVRRQLKALPSE